MLHLRQINNAGNIPILYFVFLIAVMFFSGLTTFLRCFCFEKILWQRTHKTAGM